MVAAKSSALECYCATCVSMSLPHMLLINAAEHAAIAQFVQPCADSRVSCMHAASSECACKHALTNQHDHLICC